MIWSVSTSERSSGTARPVTTVTGFIGAPPSSSVETSRPSSVEVGRRGEVAGDGGGGGDGGGDEVGAAAAALAALEVPVGRRRAAFAGRELVGVHGEAHRAA